MQQALALVTSSSGSISSSNLIVLSTQSSNSMSCRKWEIIMHLGSRCFYIDPQASCGSEHSPGAASLQVARHPPFLQPFQAIESGCSTRRGYPRDRVRGLLIEHSQSCSLFGRSVYLCQLQCADISCMNALASSLDSLTGDCLTPY